MWGPIGSEHTAAIEATVDVQVPGFLVGRMSAVGRLLPIALQHKCSARRIGQKAANRKTRPCTDLRNANTSTTVIECIGDEVFHAAQPFAQSSYGRNHSSSSFPLLVGANVE